MTQNRIRTALMDATVKCVARDGLDKLTTRSIASECELHDTYIYRYFIDKDDLLKRTFIREDQKMIELMLESASRVDTENLSFRENLRLLWMPAWDYLMEHPNECKFYVRYYYSVHFEKDALEEFKDNNEALKDKFRKIFFDNKEIEFLFHYNIDTMLHLTMRIATGEIENDENVRDEVFELMYSVNKVYMERFN